MEDECISKQGKPILHEVTSNLEMMFQAEFISLLSYCIDF
jgi:hypothetical protein